MEILATDGWPYPGECWWKFDLHTHTPASMDYGDSSVTPSQWLLAFMQAGVDCVAVTDHNSGEWIDKLKTELSKLANDPPAGYRPLRLFPGVELSVNSGFHLLAILDPTATSSDVDKLLGTVDYNGTKGDSDGVTKKSAINVVEAILEVGGIPIPAHADRQKGLLHTTNTSNGRRSTKIDSNTVTQVLDCDRILAMESVDSDWMKPKIFLDRKIKWTEILGSDSHCLDDSSHERFPGSHYTWVKMARPPSIEGLRLALLDGPKCSVRRSDEGDFDALGTPEHFVESIEIEKARYMGRPQPATLRFSPMLNAIVGGRGSGKSTVVHALRLAAGRESEIARLNSASVPRSTFENFRRVPRNRFEGGALTNDTQILWIVVRDGIRHRITWQNNHTDVTVEYEAEDHSWTESSSQSVTPERFPIRIFSQGQIAELTTGSQPALLHLIDESAGLSALKSRLVEAHNKYFKSKTNIRELERQLQLEADLSVQLEDVERKLKHFDSSDYSSVLKTYRHRVRQQAEASNRFTRIDKIARRIDRWSKTIQLDDTPEGLLDKSTLAGQSYFEVVNSLDKKVDRVAGVLQKEAETLRSIVKEKKRLLSGSVWQKETDKAKEKYHHLVTDIQNERNLDPSEYGFLIQERQQLRRDLDNLESKKKERSRRMEESFKCLLEIQEVRRSISNKRQEFLSSTLAGNDFVEVSVKPYSEDIREIERSLRRVLGVMDRRFQNDILTFSNGQPKAGIVADLFRDLSTDSSQRSGVLECRLETLKARLESACQGEEQFGGHFNNYLNREFDQDPSFLDRIWAWFPEDGLSVKYSPAGDGSAFRPIEQASAGQRSAALLAFILTHGTDPLLLDQPEDDLDNRLIYDLIVRQIREGKISRQIIVVTHNPNIVINGDAELVHVMEFVSRLGQCVVLASGSLEEDRIQEEVCQVMEGGREAFRSRYRRLKMELPNV